KRGRPPKKGKDVKLQALFASQAEFFTQTKLTMYGQKTAVSYLRKDLLWGKELYQTPRFVLLNYNGWQSILACTNLIMHPEEIIKLYCLRFKTASQYELVTADAFGQSQLNQPLRTRTQGVGERLLAE
ncbi:MAG: hypothetical protein LBS62_03580, partial [Clostridiales bacterium]|nr:hypothetical protein [Clostridiales bacterium]